MKAKRIFAILIAVLMCISTLMSCKDNNTDTPSDTDGNTELKTESTTTAPPPSTTLISRTAQVDIGFHAPFSRMYVTITPRAGLRFCVHKSSACQEKQMDFRGT